MKRLSNHLTLTACLLLMLSAARIWAQANPVLRCGHNAKGQLGNNSATDSLLLTPT